MSSTTNALVSYDPGIESLSANETELESENAGTPRNIGETTLRAGVPLRSLHAKSHGRLYGRLSVAATLSDQAESSIQPDRMSL